MIQGMTSVPASEYSSQWFSNSQPTVIFCGAVNRPCRHPAMMMIAAPSMRPELTRGSAGSGERGGARKLVLEPRPEAEEPVRPPRPGRHEVRRWRPRGGGRVETYVPGPELELQLSADAPTACCSGPKSSSNKAIARRR